MTAPILLGYFCNWCGAMALQQPWDIEDGWLCANCEATNWPPLRHEPPDLRPA